MGESIHGKIKELLDYEALSGIHPLKIPKIEKKDIPDFIKCPKYEKALNSLNQKMERYQSKVDKCDDDIKQMNANIEQMERELKKWKGDTSTFMLDRTDVKAVEKQNHAVKMYNGYLDKISVAQEKINDLIDKKSEAIEEAEEKLQELTAEAMLVIDDDIVEVLDRCGQIVNKLENSQSTNDFLLAIDLCLIKMKIFAMFEDFIEGNSQRKDCRNRINEVNPIFTNLCAKEEVMKYLVDMYQRNQGLIQKNADLCQQVEQALKSVDQDKLAKLTQPIDAVLTEKINTSFEYKDIIDPTELDAVIVQIKKTIEALNKNIVKVNEAVTAASDFAKTGVSADQQATTILTSMKSNIDSMKNEIISNDHFTVIMLDEGVIDEFYHKDIKPAITALRKHLIGSIGEKELDNLLKNDQDRFSVEKADNAIKQSNLTRLQVAVDKVPSHVNKTKDLISTAERDIQEAEKVPKQKADSLRAELNSKYIQACLPIICMFAAIGIIGRIKAYESAFRSSNQIYKDLVNILLEKNSKINKAVMIIGAIFGIGGVAVFFLLNLGSVLLGIIGIAFLFFVVTVLILSTVGKRLQSFLHKN